MVSTEKHLLAFMLDGDRDNSEVVGSVDKQDSWDSKLSLPNVEVINAQELILRNFPPNDAGLNALTHVFSAPLPLHQLDNEGQFPKDILMVSSGPYRLKKSENSKEVRFERNAKFAGKKVYFSDVNFYFGEYKDLIGRYLSFGLDILEGVDIKQVQWLKNYYPKDLQVHSDGSDFLELRNANDGKYSKSIRKAMLSMINRDVIYELLNASEQDKSTGLIPWKNIKYSREPASKHHFLSIEEAKSVMESAGFSKENRLKICIGIAEFRSFPKIDNYLKTQWRSIYIDVEFKQMTDEQFESGGLNIYKDPPCIGVIHLYASRFQSEEEILDMLLGNDFLKDYRFTNRNILELNKQIKRTVDPDQRVSLVAKLERKMLDTYKVFRLNNHEGHSLVKPYITNYSWAKGNGAIALSQYMSVQE
jgi:ABC-type oligopeptide transport system substrate-binding subunit